MTENMTKPPLRRGTIKFRHARAVKIFAWPFLGTQHHYLQVHSFVQMQISLCRPWATELEEAKAIIVMSAWR